MTHNSYWVYILTNGRNSVFYVGMTNNLERRLAEHRAGQPGSFTTQYNVWKLVYAERYRTPREAIEREKRLKRWHRAWKVELVATMNPRFQSLTLAELGERIARLEDKGQGQRRGDPGSPSATRGRGPG